MSDFYSAFEKQRSDYLEHWGIKGMKWGVVNQKPQMGYQQQGMPGQQPAQSYPVNSFSGMSEKEVQKEISKRIKNAGNEHIRKMARRAVLMAGAVATTRILIGVINARKKSKIN